MATSVRTKARKKQPSFALVSSKSLPESPADARRLEQAMMDLEDAVFQVLSTDRGNGFQDVDFLYWTRTLKNIATQVSLALAECRGPRQFHQHYRHDPKDYDHLYPVSGPTGMETLVRVCRDALLECAEMVGVQDEEVLHERTQLEHALRLFLSRAGSGVKH